jgi:nucleotide-binding universal stress UspA family protein
MDLSAGSKLAIEQAAEWARREGAPLLVAHVAPVHVYGSLEVPRIVAALEGKVRELTDVPAQCVLESGAAHAGLLELAATRHARLIVVGASGAGAVNQALFGSTAQSVLRYAHCPVLVARESPADAPIVVATDFSEAAEFAIEMGIQQARARGVEVALLHSTHQTWSPLDLLGPLVISAPAPSTEAVQAVRDTAVQMLGSALAAHDGKGRTLLVDEPPATAIEALTAEAAASLVVVGTHGRTGLRRMALGSVAEAVARRASCSVLVARAVES